VWSAGDARDGEIGAADRIGFRMLHRDADLRIFPSEITRAQTIARYGHGGDAIVVPPGAWPRLPDGATRADIRRAMGIPPTSRALLVFGDLRHASGCDIALDALDHLPAAQYRLLIGGRAIPPFGETLVRAANARRGVHLVAAQLDAQHLDDLLYAADVVLFPARAVTDSSGPLRALSRGRAVVVTDLPLFRETLGGESDACAFAPPQDATGLARAIERLLDVPFERREESALGIAAHRSWERSVEPFAGWLDRHCGHDARSSLSSAGVRPPRASVPAASSAPVSP
jgi:glycosyltransferase involved in cell wall biosynthesis